MLNKQGILKMLNKKKYIYICILFLSIIYIKDIFSAAFSPARSLINVPIAEYFVPGDLEIAANGGFNSVQNLEFDFKLQYSITKKINIAAAIINYHQITFNLQGTFVSLTDPFPMHISAGILNLSTKLNMSDWDHESAEKLNNLAHFIVFSMPKKTMTLHAGIGKKKYLIQDTNVQNIDGPLIGTMFFGLEKPLKNGSLLCEFDGEFLNFGYKKQFTKKTIGKVALTEFGNSNPNTQVRFFSFGLATGKNIFNVYKEEIDYIQNNLNQIESLSLSLKSTENELKQELVRVQKTKEALIKKVKQVGQKPNKIITGKTKDALAMYSDNYILAYSHYENAYEAINKRQYLTALEFLSKAINEANDIPIFYRKRGSVYYLIKQQDNALNDWSKAYKMNPEDPKLLQLPQKILKEVQRRSTF